jgi:uncharacterized membrane protein YtjA (UPF0391 family)
MLYWIATFLFVSFSAVAMRVSGLAGLSLQAAWALFLTGMILALMIVLNLQSAAVKSKRHGRRWPRHSGLKQTHEERQ